MKKLILLLMLLPAYAHAMCLQFYYDQYGQSHSMPCSAQPAPEVECAQKGDFYWDGKYCREIKPAQNCKLQKGEWRGIQIVGLAGGFYNVCICPDRQFWNGIECVADLPYPQKCQIRVWCESKRQNINLMITPKALGLEYCPPD